MRKKSLERHFHEIIISRAGSKHDPYLMNNITNIFAVLDLIVLQIKDCFGADLSGKVIWVVWSLLQ